MPGRISSTAKFIHNKIIQLFMINHPFLIIYLYLFCFILPLFFNHLSLYYFHFITFVFITFVLRFVFVTHQFTMFQFFV